MKIRYTAPHSTVRCTPMLLVCIIRVAGGASVNSHADIERALILAGGELGHGV
jgi:hypothetical protein